MGDCETVVVVPTDPTLLAKFKKKNIKAKSIIVDSVKDRIIPRVLGRLRISDVGVTQQPILELKPKLEDGASRVA